MCSQNFQTTDEISSQKYQEAQETWRAFLQQLSAWEKIIISPMVKLLMKRVKQRYLWREQLRFETTWFANAARQCYLAIAKYFIEQGWIAHRDDIFYLLPDEIQQAIENTKQSNILRELVDKRQANYDTWHDLKMPLHMRESELQSLLRQSTANHPAETSITQLHGLCVSAGCIEGEVVILRNPREFKKMKRGAILVAPATDPSWTPLFTLAIGVLVEIGGILSHASLVAREYGLPALANVKNATTLLHDGQRIRLDATNGIVILLD